MLSCVLIGFGQIGYAASQDPKTREFYKFNNHYETILAHPEFELVGVVEPNLDTRKSVAELVGEERTFSDLPSLSSNVAEVDLCIVASPPVGRLETIKTLPPCRMVLLEKPIASNLMEAEQICHELRRRNISAQVNTWRRFDQGMRRLANGQLKDLIGSVQTGTAVFGNGWNNNGVHVVDLIRMLLGEIDFAQRISFPIEIDPVGEHFTLRMSSGAQISIQEIDFSYYREINLTLFGTQGVLEIRNEGLEMAAWLRCENRALSDAFEINYADPLHLNSTVGTALYEVYSNLADCLKRGDKALSSLEASMVTAEVIERLASKESYERSSR